MCLLRRPLPVQFVVQLGTLRLISGSLLEFDDEDYADEVLSRQDLTDGFVAGPADEVGLTGLEPLEDEDDYTYTEDAQSPTATRPTVMGDSALRLSAAASCRRHAKGPSHAILDGMSEPGARRPGGAR